MASKGQTGYYNFQRPFLDLLAENLRQELIGATTLQNGEISCSALFLKSGSRFLDYFLAASDPVLLARRPNHLLIHKVALWAIENGFDFLQLGGGHPNLLFFKRGFSSLAMPYYLGKHVFDSNVYTTLSLAHHSRHGWSWTRAERFFPAYRATLEAEHD